MVATGRHNVLNAMAALIVAQGRGIPAGGIAKALATFRSVKRRMDVKGEIGGVLVVDDFAHHPTAVKATIEAARGRWPGRRLWAILEPRSNSMRRKVFQDALPKSLALGDRVILGGVFRASNWAAKIGWTLRLSRRVCAHSARTLACFPVQTPLRSILGPKPSRAISCSSCPTPEPRSFGARGAAALELLSASHRPGVGTDEAVSRSRQRLECGDLSPLSSASASQLAADSPVREQKRQQVGVSV